MQRNMLSQSINARKWRLGSGTGSEWDLGHVSGHKREIPGKVER